MSESTQGPDEGGSGLEGPADGGADGIPVFRMEALTELPTQEASV